MDRSIDGPADFIETTIARTSLEAIGKRPMLVFSSTPEASWALVCKRFVDRVGAALMILLTSPLWIIAAIGIKLSSRSETRWLSQGSRKMKKLIKSNFGSALK